MGYHIEISKSAESDLDQILRYICAELSNPPAASAFLQAVNCCFDQLESMPLMYEKCRDPRLNKLGYRRAVIQHYVMVYKVQEDRKTVSILRFFYGPRKYESLI